ncbi:hypothetical protein ACEPAF_8835 [Sanghuangporus sanghuang]
MDTTRPQDNKLDDALKALIEKRDGLMSSLGEKGKSADASASTLVSAVDAVVSLHNKMTALSSRIAAEEDKIKATSTVLDSITEIVKRDIGDQAVAIEQLIDVTVMLELKALGYKGSHQAIIVRRDLDDIRSAVAHGFISLMPDEFSTHNLLDRSDPLKRSVIWWKFIRSLSDTWKSYYGRSGNSMFQNYSALECVSCTADLEFLCRYLLDLIQPKIDCDEEGRVPDENGGGWLARQLKFFVPAFIRAYTEEKKVVIQCSGQVQYYEELYQHYEDWLQALVDPQRTLTQVLQQFATAAVPKKPSDEDGLQDKLVLGTALELRQQDVWRHWLGQLKAQWEEHLKLSDPDEDVGQGEGERSEAQKRKADDDGGAHGGPRPRLNPDMSTSIHSYAAEGLQKAHLIYPDEGKPPQITGKPDDTYPPERVPASDPKHSTYLGYVKRRAEILKPRIEAIEELGDSKEKFETYRKCLHILLSNNIRRLAVTGPSALRIASNHLAHARHPYDKDYEECLQDVAQLLKTAQQGLAGDPELSDSFSTLLASEEGTHTKELQEAHKLLTEDNYLVEDGVSLEKAIDSFIEAELSDHKAPTYMDNVILLKWLDSVKPVQTNQEPETTGSKAKAA